MEKKIEPGQKQKGLKKWENLINAMEEDPILQKLESQLLLAPKHSKDEITISGTSEEIKHLITKISKLKGYTVITTDRNAKVKEDSEETPLAPIVKKTLPMQVHIARVLTNRYSLLEGEFFSKALSKENRKFDEDDFCALIFAVGQKLYNDSYATGRAKKLNIGRALSEKDDVFIEMDLIDIIKYGYGTDGKHTQHREEILELIDALHTTPLVNLDSNGKGNFRYLLVKTGGTIEKFKTHRLRLRVDKIFCDMTDGFGKFPQDTMRRLIEDSGRISSIDRRLLLHLCAQSNKEPHVDSIENLAQKLGRFEEYKHDRKRFITSLITVLERFKRIEIIKDYKMLKSKSVMFIFPPSKKRKILPK